MSTILVVDDKEMMRDSVGSTLQRAGFTVVTAAGGEPAAALVAKRRPDAVVTDLKMPGVSGLDLLERIREIDEDLPVVIMTAFAEVESAVRAMKLGAFDYVTKPFEGDELVITIKRAINHARLLKENAVLRVEAGDALAGADASAGPRGLDRLIGTSPAMRRVKEQVRALAESQGTVLVYGESGTGKEVVARAVHDLSPRCSGAFLAVNCAALSESLLESELFGHEKGSFTGAERLRKGRFELADGGTLLLDEVSEVGPATQAKLLRVLQERAFERVGSSLPIGVDVRVIAASNRDLPRAVSRGDFRQDLFFRLNVLPLHLPPLRDRAEDVAPLAEHFIAAICRREGREPAVLEPGALDLLRGYSWPGNVRELQNICERAVVLCGQERTLRRDRIEPWLLGVAPGAMAAPVAAGGHLNGHAVSVEPKPAPAGAVATETTQGVRKLEDIERDVIVQTLRGFNGHRQRTARALGIGVRTLGLKLKKWKELRLVAETL